LAEIAAAVLVDGYEVVAASGVEDALRLVESERPGLVLIDLDLPGIDATELLTALRATATYDLPILVMSATDDRHTRNRAMAAGATGFVPKPFTDSELRTEVATILQRRPTLVDHPA